MEAAAREALERANRDVNGLADPLFDRPLEYAADGHEADLEGVDQYCLAQVWNLD